MNAPKTADELMPLVAALSPGERIRLIQLLAEQSGAADARSYSHIPTREGEFLSDDDSLAWDAEGWEEFC
jgi:hypothetical protein